MYLTRNEKEKCIMARMCRGGKLYQANFTLKQYGTWEEAEAAAQNWVNQTLPTIPEAVPVKGRKTKRNSSGIVGVQFAKQHPHKSGARNGADRWLAFWPSCPNAGGISWSVEKYGDEQAFIRAAIARELETIDRKLIDQEFENLIGTSKYKEILQKKLI